MRGTDFCTFDSSDEAVPALREGFDETRPFSVVSQSFPESINSFVETAIEVNERVTGPQSFCKLFPCHNLAGVLQQQNEHLKGLLLQLYLGTLAT
jgi:hypothetical protein